MITGGKGWQTIKQVTPIEPFAKHLEGVSVAPNSELWAGNAVTGKTRRV